MILSAIVSDRVDGWESNYRVPDVVVYPRSDRAGGLIHPKLIVEVVTPNDQTIQKLDFYSRCNCQELLIVDRHPWQLSMYKLVNGVLVASGNSTPENRQPLISGVLPLSFRMISHDGLPTIKTTNQVNGLQNFISASRE